MAKKRQSLREFQQDLTRRLAEVKLTGRRSALLAVNAGPENWLLDLSEAGEIIAAPSLTPVPLTRNWFRGLANVRGNLYSVVDFAAFCGESPTQLTSDARILLIGTRQGMNTALLVSRALGLRNPEDFDPDDVVVDSRAWVGGAVRDSQDRLWRKLTVRPLLADARFLDATLDTHA
jgi:twitching motility protein PilI